jgi:hypothetical protein
MLLLELFNDIYSYTKVDSRDYDFVYEFKAASMAEDDSKSNVQVIFYKDPYDIWSIVFNRDEDTAINNGGDALKIFATVLDIIQMFDKEHKPKYLSFTAKSNEPSRIKLYQRLVKRIPNFIDITDTPKKANVNVQTWLSYEQRHQPNEKTTLLARKDEIK